MHSLRDGQRGRELCCIEIMVQYGTVKMGPGRVWQALYRVLGGYGYGNGKYGHTIAWSPRNMARDNINNGHKRNNMISRESFPMQLNTIRNHDSTTTCCPILSIRNSQYPFLIVSYFSANCLRHCFANSGFFCALISARTSRAWILTVGTSSGDSVVLFLEEV